MAKVLHNFQVNDSDFIIQEFESVRKQLRNGRQPGPSNIPPEVLKRCDLDNIILEFASRLLKEDAKPKQWSELYLIPLPKTGDLSEAVHHQLLLKLSTT